MGSPAQLFTQWVRFCMSDKWIPDFPSEFQVGSTPIRPATVLAPMAGVTDTVFRRLIRNQGGCGLIMTEFTSSHGVVSARKAKKPNRTFRYLYFEPEEHPIFGAAVRLRSGT